MLIFFPAFFMFDFVSNKNSVKSVLVNFECALQFYYVIEHKKRYCVRPVIHWRNKFYETHGCL